MTTAWSSGSCRQPAGLQSPSGHHLVLSCMQASVHLLQTEGSKLVMVVCQSSFNQGVYGLVTNLGSLVVRTLFFPVEEAAFRAFSRPPGNHLSVWLAGIITTTICVRAILVHTSGRSVQGFCVMMLQILPSPCNSMAFSVSVDLGPKHSQLACVGPAKFVQRLSSSWLSPTLSCLAFYSCNIVTTPAAHASVADYIASVHILMFSVEPALQSFVTL